MNDTLKSVQSRLHKSLALLKSHSHHTDLVTEMEQMLAKLEKPLLLIPVTGDKGSGKTTFVNAMLEDRYKQTIWVYKYCNVSIPITVPTQS